MRRLLTLIAVFAVMVAFTLPMRTAHAASHGKIPAMNPCEAKAKAKEAMNPCEAKAKAKKAMNPCNPCADKDGMADKAKKIMDKGKKMMK